MTASLNLTPNAISSGLSTEPPVASEGDRDLPPLPPTLAAQDEVEEVPTEGVGMSMTKDLNPSDTGT